MPSNARIVPDVTGMTYERANDELGGGRPDLASASTSPTPTSPRATSSAPTPTREQSVSPGQEVRVYVSTGQETATVPTLEGLGQDAAAAALQDAGLALGSVTPRNDPALAAGTVISADQPAGADAPARSRR